MGTLGCINDMLQRDKENRELRKLNRDRMKEHHKYLVGKGKNADLSNGKSSVSCPLKPSDSAPLKHSTMPP